MTNALLVSPFNLFFFFNDPATTEIYTLSLHDALPILKNPSPGQPAWPSSGVTLRRVFQDRKSTRLNSSHVEISYAVFCLKKKHEHDRDLLYNEGPAGHTHRRTTDHAR